MANLYSKNDSNYKKYISPAYDSGLESINGSRTLTFESVPGIKEKTFRATLKNNAFNRQALDTFRDEAFKRWRGGNALGVKVETDKGTFEFSRLSTVDAKVGQGFNKGDTAEGLLAAAMAARFVSKTKKIAKSDVVKVLKSLKRTSKDRAIQSFDSPNENKNIVDKVNLVIGIAEKNMNALLDPKVIDGFFDDLMNSVIFYSNKGSVRDWADLLYKNNRVDTIDINADGLTDQKGTKVDLFVLINGERENLNLSLKAGAVKQFGQMSGATFDVMAKLFKPLGVRFSSPDQNKFNKLLADKRLKMHSKSIAAVSYAYQQAAKQITDNLKNNQDQTVEMISKFIKYHATLNEEGVSLVQLNNNEAQIYEFDKLLPALKKDSKELTVSIVDQRIGAPASNFIESKPKMTLPKIVIHPVGFDPNMGLLEIRSKIDSKGASQPFYHRNYLNKGKYLTKLIAY